MVTLAIKSLVDRKRFLRRIMLGMLAVAPRAYMGSQAIGIVGLVGYNDGVLAKVGKKRFSAGQIVGLARCDQDLDRPALVVDARQNPPSRYSRRP